ncbi:hypothetical protein J6590_036703 [Homalodisca vitripennis]|nr:hypothetical protein J6590_036703 [Homalodisca vitripennis]
MRGPRTVGVLLRPATARKCGQGRLLYSSVTKATGHVTSATAMLLVSPALEQSGCRWASVVDAVAGFLVSQPASLLSALCGLSNCSSPSSPVPPSFVRWTTDPAWFPLSS